MSKATSPYYPPRARWYAAVFRIGEAVRRGTAMDRIHLPSSVTWRGLAACFLVPGLGFYLRGPRVYGRTAMAACAVLCLIFIAGLGSTLGNLAFGFIISIHVSSFAYYCGPAMQAWELKNRLLFSLLVLLSLGFLYYGPLRDLIQNHLLMPLRIDGRVVVVQKLAPIGSVKRGDWVAYRLPSSYEAGDDVRVHIHSGTGFGPVLGVAGDTVEFSTNGVFVNGVLNPPQPYMPTSGSLVVAQNQWFIWPAYSVRGHGYQGRITAVMLQMANVSKDQYAGKPFKEWFWRKQVLP